jgi:transcriptional regulator with XRE-family HTH domain
MRSELSKRILLARKAKGLSRNDLAKAIDLHFSMIGNYERGESAPAAETLGKLATVLSVSVDYLLNVIPETKEVEGVTDIELFTLFRKIEQLPSHKKYIVKYFISAFVFKTEVEKQLNESTSKEVGIDVIDAR